MRPQAMLQRICWSRDWKRPSSHSTGETGYVQANGFGHEEWNFNLNDAADGCVQGHIPYQPSELVRAKAADRFEVAFWAKSPNSTDKLLVGFYRGAEIADLDDFHRMAEVFRERSILERRVHEVNAVRSTRTADTRELVNPAKRTVGHWLRCRVNEVEVLTECIPLPDRILGHGVSQRFNKANLLERMPTIEEFKDWRPLT